MRFFQAFLVVALLAGTTACDDNSRTLESDRKKFPPLFGLGGSDPQKDRDAEQALSRYFDVSKRNVLRGVTMVAHFAGQLPSMKKTAQVEAKRSVAPDGAINYDFLQREGDSTVQKEIIFRFINTEIESATKGVTENYITPESYKFKYKGLQQKDTEQVHVFEVIPRKKKVGLFRGELWVDAKTGLTVHEAGRFVKNPSVFLKRVEFTRDYEIKDGKSIPKSIQSVAETRFWGTAELNITYTDLTFDRPTAQLVTP